REAQGSHDEETPQPDEAIRVFESVGDLRGLTWALDMAGQIRLWGGDASGAIADLEHAAACAREAGDRSLEADVYRGILLAAINGSTPVTVGLRIADDALQRG